MSLLKILTKASLGIFILLFLIYYVGVEKIYSTFLGIKLVYLPLFLFLSFLELVMGTTALNVIIRCIHKKIGFWKILGYHLRSFSLGLFVPAKLGEVSFIYFLNKEAIEIGKASVIFILDKLITFITLSAVATIGVFILLDQRQSIAILSFLLLLFLIILFLIVTTLGRNIVKKYILRKYSRLFSGFSETFFYLLRNKSQYLLLNFLIGLIRWSIGALSVYTLFLAFGATPNLLYVWLITPLTIIISLIPISIAGLGVRESSAIILYKAINIPSYITASVYFTFTAINYIIASIVNLYYLYRR